jgi:hypothetical protein
MASTKAMAREMALKGNKSRPERGRVSYTPPNGRRRGPTWKASETGALF